MLVVKGRMQNLLLFFTLAFFLSIVLDVRLVDSAGANPAPVPAPPILQIFIDSDGKVTPATPMIQRVGNVYTFTSDLTNASIEIQCDNIMIDGAGFTLQGNGESGIILKNRSNVIIRNLHIKDYVYSISLSESSNIIILNNQMLTAWNVILDSSSGNQIIGNNLTGREPEFGYCIRFKNNSSSNTIVGNSFSDAGSAVWISGKNNTFYHNNFLSNKNNVVGSSRDIDNLWDNGKEGNFWSDYRGFDTNGDGIGDKPHIIDDDNRQDRYPLMAPFNIDSVTFELPQWANNSTEEPPKSEPSKLPLPEAEPSPTTIAIVALSIIAIISLSAGLTVHFKKHHTMKHNYSGYSVPSSRLVTGCYTKTSKW